MSPASILDLIAVFIFALTGGLVASRAQLDIVGFLFLACLTGVGGGTLRDLVLGRDPVFWVGSDHGGSQFLAEDEGGGHRERRDDVEPKVPAAQAGDDLSNQCRQHGQGGNGPDRSGPVGVAGEPRRQSGSKASRGDADEERTK